MNYSMIYECVCSCIKILGIEYIVSEKLFESLSPDEQKLWHSHDYEVRFYETFSKCLIYIYRIVKNNRSECCL